MTLREENNNYMKTNEQRISEYESKLINYLYIIKEKDSEILLLKNNLNSYQGYNDYTILQNKYTTLQSDYNILEIQNLNLAEIKAKLETKLRENEANFKYKCIQYDDEIIQYKENNNKLMNKINELQSIIAKYEQNSDNTNHTHTGEDPASNILSENTAETNHSNSPNTNTTTNNNNSTANNNNVKMAQLMDQIQSISKQLLKKQEQNMELQTEKSVLKSRISDLQTRYGDMCIYMCLLNVYAYRDIGMCLLVCVLVYSAYDVYVQVCPSYLA